MDDATLKRPDPTRPPIGAPVPGLTLLYHTELDRVGERVPLAALEAGGSVALSRREPVFHTADGAPTRALDDPYVSRRPVRLTGVPGGVRIEAEGVALRVDRRPVTAATVPREALDAGVVLELADRVVLLLHRFREGPASPAPQGLVGESDALRRLRGELASVAALPVPVLLRGASGSGKERVARALHAASDRSRRPFVAVNLAAIPPGTAAAELFGHARGAFTGAVSARDGFFQQAHGGTLFLDEVGEAPPEVQVALLRALETGEVQPVGGGTARVDVRLIAATDADLEGAVADGRFRLPLLHRLAAYELEVPPLRSRRDDLGRLLVAFLREDLGTFGGLDRLAPGAEPWLPPSLVARLALAPWPGNVRQLRNVARQLVVAGRTLPQAVTTPAIERVLAPEVEASVPAASGEVSDADLLEALRAHAWKVGPAASALGLSRQALYRRIDAAPNIRKARDLDADAIGAALEACGGDVDAAAAHLEVSARGLRLRMTELG